MASCQRTAVRRVFWRTLLSSKERPRVCCRFSAFSAIRVAATNVARQGAGRRQWWFPCQVPQRRLAIFAAQPEGPGLFLRDAAFLVADVEQPNFAPRALPRAKTGSGPDARRREQALAAARLASTCPLKAPRPCPTAAPARLGPVLRVSATPFRRPARVRDSAARSGSSADRRAHWRRSPAAGSLPAPSRSARAAARCTGQTRSPAVG